MVLAEAGARAVYCIDLPKEPSEDWEKTKLYAEKLQGKLGEGRLEYISGNVTDQVGLSLIAIASHTGKAVLTMFFHVGSDVEDW